MGRLGVCRVKSQEDTDVILQICMGGVASGTIDVFGIHIPLELLSLNHYTLNQSGL